MKSTRPKNTTRLAGFFAVDAGLCWIGDPCYFWPDDRNEQPRPVMKEAGAEWADFCNTLEQERFDERGTADFDGLGVVVSTGHGDGQYPVFVTYDEDGIVSRVTIEFLIGDTEDEDEDEDEEDPDGVEY